jgi:serine/threonine protein kinase
MNNERAKVMYDFIKNHTKFSKETGFKLPDSPAFLGSGSQGVAYDIGSKKALKITGDEAEAAVAEEIRDKKLRGVYKVFGSYKFTHNPTKEQKGFIETTDIGNIVDSAYFIVMEKLKSNSHRAQEIMDSMQGISKKIGCPTFRESDDWTNKEIGKLDTKENRKLLLGDKVATNQEVDDVIEIAYGMNSLNKLGISYSDLYAGNILFDTNDKPVIIDIGYSIGAYGKPKMFEGMI